MYKPHIICRACGGPEPATGIKFEADPRNQLVQVMDLGNQPPANDFRKEGEQRAGLYPLKVLYCPRCTLAQLSVVVDPSVLYSNYNYVTSPSLMMQKHLNHVADDLEKEWPSYKSVLEIGSNDGLFLEMLKKRGKITLGCDPATNLCELAKYRGVSSVPHLFNPKTAQDIWEEHQGFDVVIARHVFSHIDDWYSTMRALEIVTHEQSLVFIEVPCPRAQLRNGSFDQIYHEHLSYMTVDSMEALCRRSAFEIDMVREYPIHGGAIGVFLRRRGTFSKKKYWQVDHPPITKESWHELGKHMHERTTELKQFIADLRAKGHSVAALGASAKSTVWVNLCHFSRAEIAFIADETRWKWFSTSPGSNIPIVDEGAIIRERPEYVVMFAWNYKEEILDRYQGIKFIVPLPKLEVI